MGVKDVVYSKKTAILLAIIFLFFEVLPIVFAGLLSDEIYSVFRAINFLFLFFYCFGWILTANSKAMKLIFGEFVFWFKMVYLIMYLVTSALISYISEWRIYVIVSVVLCQSLLFTLTMITDALNISKSSKMLLTAYALASFAMNSLLYQQASFYQTHVYKQANITIPNYFGLDTLHMNIVDIGYQSAQILAIFSAKQIFAVVKNPKKASIIKKNPFIVYEDREDNFLSVKNVRMWKIICIGWWLIALLYACLLFVTLKGKLLLMVILFLILIIICLHIFGYSIKALFAANIIILNTTLLCCIGIYLFEWYSEFVGGMFIGHGLSAIYTLKIKQFNQDKTTRIVLSSQDFKRANNADLHRII